MPILPFRNLPSYAPGSSVLNTPCSRSPREAPTLPHWQRVRSQIRVLEILNPDAGPVLEKLLADLIGDCRR